MSIAISIRDRIVGALRRCSWVAVLAIIAVRLIFVITYPLNDFGGDAQNYESMLLRGESSLVHAGGYPFLIGLPFRLAGIHRLHPDTSLPYVLLVAQHVIDMLVLIFLYRIMSVLYGRAAGALTILLMGFSIQAGRQLLR